MMRNKHALLLLTLTVATMIAPLRATSQWVQLKGPYGGSIMNITANGDNVFASTSTDIYRSSDGGTRWTQIGSPAKLFPTVVAMESSVLAGTYEGVFRSDDNGKTWTEMNNGLPTARINAFLVDGTELYCATNMGLFMTTDRGSTWLDLNSLNLNGININVVVKKGDKVFVSSTTDGIFSSSDKGETWQQLGNDLPNSNITSLAVSDSKIFASMREGVYSTPSDKVEWSLVSEDIPALKTAAQLTMAGNAVIAAAADGIYRSVDEGKTWTNSNDAGARGVIGTGQTVFALSNFNVLRSDDQGAHWVASDTGITAATVYTIESVTNASNATTLFAACAGIHASTDNGNTWRKVYQDYATCLTKVGQDVFAGANFGVVRLSQDGSSVVPAGLDSYSLTTLFAHGGVLYASGTDQDYTRFYAWRSSDLGVTWTELDIQDDRVFKFTSIDGDVFAAMSSGKVLRSTDEGNSWISVSNGLSAESTYGIGAYQGNLYAGQGYLTGLSYRSQDRGATWQEMTSLGSGVISDFLGAGGSLFVAGDAGFFRSTNNGITWDDEDSQPAFYGTLDLNIANGNVFAATTSRGIWRRALGDFGISSVSRRAGERAVLATSPNPAENILRFEASQHPDKIRIVNMLGQTLLSFVSAEIHTNEIDISALPAGSYIADVHIGDHILQSLFVKR